VLKFYGCPLMRSGEDLVEMDNNTLRMETLQIIGLVERSGVGLDRIFMTSISEGKGAPDFFGTNDEYVVLNIPAKIKDLNFVYYLKKVAAEKQITFGQAKDFVELENIRKFGKSNDKARLRYFLENGLIEKIGIGKGTKYILSKQFYEFIDKRSEYTRLKWLNKDEQKMLLLNYLKQHEKGRMRDFRELFKERPLKNQQINRLLNELAGGGVDFEGKRRSKSGYWKIKGNSNDIEK